MSEILLGVKHFPQPSPSRNPGGDCFACSLKAAVDFLYPEKPVDFNQVWEAFETTTVSGNKALSNSWPMMSWAAPHNLEGYRLDVHRDIIMPMPDLDHWSYSWGFRVNEQEWAKRLEAWLSAGWVAIAEQSYQPAPSGPPNKQNWTDHFVVLDGQRSFWQESKDGMSASLQHETHVVCSGKGSYWIDTSDLLHLHGVNALVLLRRSNYPRRPYTE